MLAEILLDLFSGEISRIFFNFSFLIFSKIFLSHFSNNLCSNCSLNLSRNASKSSNVVVISLFLFASFSFLKKLIDLYKLIKDQKYFFVELD